MHLPSCCRLLSPSRCNYTRYTRLCTRNTNLILVNGGIAKEFPVRFPCRHIQCKYCGWPPIRVTNSDNLELEYDFRGKISSLTRNSSQFRSYLPRFGVFSFLTMTGPGPNLTQQDRLCKHFLFSCLPAKALIKDIQDRAVMLRCLMGRRELLPSHNNMNQRVLHHDIEN